MDRYGGVDKKIKRGPISRIIKGYRVQIVANTLKLSLTDVCKLNKRLKGDTGVQVKPRSITSQAFMLFKKNTTLVDAVIELDISSHEATKLKSDYLTPHGKQNIGAMMDNDD